VRSLALLAEIASAENQPGRKGNGCAARSPSIPTIPKRDRLPTASGPLVNHLTPSRRSNATRALTLSKASALASASGMRRR